MIKIHHILLLWVITLILFMLLHPYDGIEFICTIGLLLYPILILSFCFYLYKKRKITMYKNT